MELYEEIVRLKKEGVPSALATIVQCVGSSPQKEGAKMLLREDGSVLGTLGGGCLEAEVLQVAKMAIRDGSPRTLPFELTERHGGLVCGGKVLVYIEPVIPDPDLVILGAGHVGKALSKLAGFAGFRVTVTDDRAEHANRENIPDADNILVAGFQDVFSHIMPGRGTYIVIATRGHNHDLEALRAALRTEAQYIGLLGSRRKKALLYKTLEGEGFAKEALNRIITPVGLDIGSVTPEEIAISILAQIIMVRRGNATKGVSSSACCGFIEADGSDKATPSSG
jgi:xanthine dehydrogenase accessory factor